MKKTQFRDQATKLNRVCDDILELMPRLFKRMNRIMAEYRHQNLEQLTRHKIFKEIADQRQLEALQLEESRQKAIDARRELAITKFIPKDVVSGVLYAKSAPDGTKIICTKIGKTNNPQRRIMEQNNALPVPDTYLIEMDVKDMVQAETLAHRLLDTRNARVIAKKEFFYITNEDAISFVQFIANTINTAYDVYINPALDRYIEEYAISDWKFNDVVEEQEQAAEEGRLILKRTFIVRVLTELLEDNDSITITKQNVMTKMKEIKNSNEFSAHRTKLQPDITWVTDADDYDITLPAKYARGGVVIKRKV